MTVLKKDFYPLLRLIMPLVLTGLLQSSIWFFETIFLAQLGPDILAAGSLVSWLMGTVIVILFGTLSSINVLVAHKHGAKDEQGILLVIRDGFWLALLCAVPVFLLFWYMSPLFLLLGQSPGVVVLAESYLHAMAFGVFPNALMIALLEVIIGLGQSRLILIVNICSVSLTIALSFILIFGKFGLPALGITGAGWGMTLSNWIIVFTVVVSILINKHYKQYFSFLFNPMKPSYFIELVHVGLPMGFMYCIEVGFFFALTLLMGSLGTVVLAANQIVLQYLGILMNVVFSIAQAITVRMGHLLGAGDRRSAGRVAYAGIFFSIILMSLVALVYCYFPAYLIAIDFDVHQLANVDIVRFATQLLLVSAVFQIVESIRIALFGTLRALKDTRFTLFISILSFWGIALPVGYFLAKNTDFGATGLWWGMVLGASISVLLLSWRFKVKM